MVKRLSCLPSKQAARVRLPFGVYNVRAFVFQRAVFLPYFEDRDTIIEFTSISRLGHEANSPLASIWPDL